MTAHSSNTPPETQNLSSILGDRPIDNHKKDLFDADPRIVNQIYELIDANYVPALTIAVTGEWGSGKSSVLNLLKNKFRKVNKERSPKLQRLMSRLLSVFSSKKSQDTEYIIINFEPLVEGKTELKEIIELFYLRLYSALSKKLEGNRKNKDKFNNILKSFYTVCVSGTNLNIGPVGINLDKKVKKLLSIWKNQSVNSFSEQTAEINQILKENSLKVLVFIDELDRLPPKEIVNFLTFARILENFDQLISIIAIDYQRLIQGLTGNAEYQLTDYSSTKIYLDKLFHTRFHVHHSNELLANKLVKKGLEEIFSKNFTDSIFSYVRHSNPINDIPNYLETPRQIKKWLTLIARNKMLIKYYPEEKRYFLIFCAICIKHPFVVNNLAKHTLPMRTTGTSLNAHLNSRYGPSTSSKKFSDKHVIINSLGLVSYNSEKSNVNKTIEDQILKETLVIDDLGYKWLEEHFELIKPSILVLFSQGYSDKKHVEIYKQYFSENSGDVEEALRTISSTDVDEKILDDLRQDIANQLAFPKIKVCLDKINKAWEKLLNISNSRDVIAFALLSFHDLSEVVEKVNFVLCTYWLLIILYGLDIEHGSANFDIDKLDQSKDKPNIWYQAFGIKNIKFKNASLVNEEDPENTKENIKDLITSWVSKFEEQVKINFENMLKNSPFGAMWGFYLYFWWSTQILSQKPTSSRCYLTDIFKSYLEKQDGDPSLKHKFAALLKNEMEMAEKDHDANTTCFNIDDNDLIKLTDHHAASE